MGDISASTLVTRIVGSVRDKAVEIGLSEGTIRLFFVPRHKRSVQFLGGFGADCIINFNYAIKAGESFDDIWRSDFWDKTDITSYASYEVLIAERFGVVDDPQPLPYLGIYISVDNSGNMDSDGTCALAVRNVIQDWCDKSLEGDGFGHIEKYLSLKPE